MDKFIDGKSELPIDLTIRVSGTPEKLKRFILRVKSVYYVLDVMHNRSATKETQITRIYLKLAEKNDKS